MPDTNHAPVFSATGGTVGATTIATGLGANGHSVRPVFSADGSKQAFCSLASHLVVDNTHGGTLKDLAIDALAPTSTPTGGGRAEYLNHDGKVFGLFGTDQHTSVATTLAALNFETAHTQI